MPGIKEREYLKLCADLASCLSISIAAAGKKVDLAAAKRGAKDISSRKAIAQELLKEAKDLYLEGGASPNNQLDTLLEALAEEENFLTED